MESKEQLERERELSPEEIEKKFEPIAKKALAVFKSKILNCRDKNLSPEDVLSESIVTDRGATLKKVFEYLKANNTNAAHGLLLAKMYRTYVDLMRNRNATTVGGSGRFDTQNRIATFNIEDVFADKCLQSPDGPDLEAIGREEESIFRSWARSFTRHSDGIIDGKLAGDSTSTIADRLKVHRCTLEYGIRNLRKAVGNRDTLRRE